ncbi:hypothetical protein ACGRHY_12350 [Streptomyces sp. HK10]|uniref:hypothetical protein n=1 Tax=Streptomyces sp. HK10 TaxID=3373255 RepID=UPI0037484A68
MPTNDIDLDALPPDTLVVENGQVTPVGKQVIAKVAGDLVTACRQAGAPQVVLRELPELIAKHTAEITGRRSRVEPSPLRTVLANLVGSECLVRRPGRDPLTGDRTDGRPDTDDTRLDRLPCTRQHGHGDDHSDALGRTWQRAGVPA